MDARTAMRRHTKWKLTPPEDMTAEQRRVRAETKVADALAQVVYDRRTELGWTKAELARHADMDVRMITRIEDGARPPTTPTLLRVAEALGGRITVEHDGEQSTVTFRPHVSTKRHSTPGSAAGGVVVPGGASGSKGSFKRFTTTSSKGGASSSKTKATRSAPRGRKPAEA
jgi:transcriptional regulator with XRE-family HTH domain